MNHIVDQIKPSGSYSIDNRQSTEVFKYSNVILSYVLRKLILVIERKLTQSKETTGREHI